MINLNAHFQWDNRNRIPQNIIRAQKYLDNIVLKDTDKYVPMRTGILAKSGIIGTRIGSGEIEYVAPYARKVYYGVTIHFSKSRHPLACARFFEASKAVNKKSWLAGVRRIAGGR